jgi:hypothetical protein
MQIEGKGSPQDERTCPASAVGASFDPFGEDYLADPYAFWHAARQAEPVFYSPATDPRYQDVKAIFAT